MKRISKWLTQISLGAAFAAGTIILAPSNSEATSIVINSLTVTVGDITACFTGGGCAANTGAGGPIWGAPGVVVNSADVGGNQALIVTQTGPTTYNFDTSEGHPQNVSQPGQLVNCTATLPCNVTININGTTIIVPPANNALNDFNGDPGGTQHNEAQNFTQVFDGGPGGLRVSIGYADNAHTNACADTNPGILGSISGNCLPDPFGPSATVTFRGLAVAGGCAGSTSPCFDAGAILIQVNPTPTTTTPEPASMFLLGGGLFGLIAWQRRRRK